MRPSDSAHPKRQLVPDGGESSQTPKPIVFVRSRQDDSQSATKPMAEYNPDDLIGRTFLLPKIEQGERLRATIKRKVIETSKLLDDQHNNGIEKTNFHLDVLQGRADVACLMLKFLDHLDHQKQQEGLYKFRAITGHQGPLSPQDENYKGSKYNVMVEWETGEITEEPLSLIGADGPVICAEYAKKHDLLHLDGWKRLKHIAKNQKWLASSPPMSLVDRRPVHGLAGRLTLELMVGMGNTNFTMVMPTVQSFRAGGWSGGREAHKDYRTRSFGCKRDLCPFQVSGGGGVHLASSSLATAMARKLTTYVASQSSAWPWVGR